jgi:hypothetical protein
MLALVSAGAPSYAQPPPTPSRGRDGERSCILRVVTEPTNYTKLSKKIIDQADDLTNLSSYNPVVHEITADFKPTYLPAKIVISLAVTITNYIKSEHHKYIGV